jgi:hypothetical protein
MSFRRRALFLAGLFVAVSCSDAGNPIGPEGPGPVPPRPEDVLTALQCTVYPDRQDMECTRPTPGVGSASGIFVGGTNGDFVRLTKIGHNVDADSMWFGVTLQNLIGQTLGVDSLGVVDPAGVRIFFETEPTLNGTGRVEVIPDGTAFFFDPEQPYFQYSALVDSAVSAQTTWKFKLRETATPFVSAGNFTFTVLVAAKVPHPKGWLEIIPQNPVVQAGGVDSLLARVRNQFGQGLPDGVDWTSSNTAVVTVTELTDSTSEIAGVAEGTAYVKAVSATDGVRRDSVLVTVNNAPVVTQDSISALENVTDSLPAPRLQNNVLEAGATVVPGTSATFAGGQAIVTPGGGLVYRAPAGFFGKDTVTYQVTDGTWTVPAKVVVQVEPSRYWYVRAGASGDGRDRSPFGTIAAAQAVATVADSIFVLTPADGTSAVDGPAVLKNSQALIGQGVTFDVTRTLNGQSVMVFDGTGAAPGLTRTAAGPTVTVAQNNIIRGVAIDADAGAAIFAAAPFGTLFIRETDAAPTGPALDLTTGTIDAVFNTLSALGSASTGISLTGVNGSVTATGGAISIAAAGAAAVSVTGGVSLNYPGNITQNANSPLLSIANHTGTLAFGGTLQASTGTGAQFNNANGTYTFSGAVTLNGGDAGLDVVSSNGVFTFADAAITNPSGGPAVNVVGGTPALVYRGSITHNTGRAVLVDGITADSVILRAAINSGTGGSPTGLGILVQNVTGGRVALDSVKTLFTGANPAVTLTGNTGGLVRFGGGMDITTTSGAGFAASGTDTVTVTGNNTVSTGTGVPVSLTNVNTGSSGVSFSTVSTSAGAANGIVLNGISGAGVQATGGTISGTTGAAVLLTNTNGADSVSLRGMTLSRSSGAGAVISGTTFGKLHALNTSVQATGGPGALVLATGTMSGTYSTVSSNSSTGSGVSLTGVNGTFNASAGSINTAGAAAFLLSGGSVGGTISATVGQASAVPLLSVASGHSGTITFAGNVTATNGNGLQFDNADGAYDFDGTVTLQGGDAGIDITNGSGGTFTFPTTANIVSPSTGNLVSILNSAPTFTYSGTFTKANNNVTGIFVSGNTGGSITFDGTGAKSISSGTAAAVNLSTNGSASILFSGGGLSLTSGSGAGLTATGSGTLQVTGANNTVSSTGGGTAVNIQNVTLGASGVSLFSVNATGSGANGIVLQNTGSGAFQVTGDGASDAGNTTRGRTTAKSGGGTVALGSGGTISGRSGDGVSLSSTGPVTLRNMVIQNNSGDGVQATTSNGVTIDNTRITGHTDNSALFFTGVSAPVIIHSEMENNAFGGGAPGADIHNVRLISNTGTGSVQSSVIANTSAGAERQLQIFSTTGTLNVSVSNSRFSGSTLGDGVGVYAFGSSNITANFQNDSIHDNSAFGIDAGTETTQSSSLNITVNGTKFRNNFVGVTVAHGSSGTNTFNVTNNNFQNHGSVSVNINRLGAVGFTGFGLFSGTVSGNTIGTAGVANSGSALGSNTIDVKTNGNGGTTRVAIVNNTIREIGNDGIRVIGRDANTGHTLHARIQNNNIANFHASALTGVRGELGAASGDIIAMCLNITGNTVTGAPQNGIRVRSVAGGSPPPQIALTMPAYDGTGATYLANQNPAATGLTANTSFANGNAGSTTTAGNCTTP